MVSLVGSEITTCSGLEGVARHQFTSDARSGTYWQNDYIAVVACDTDGSSLEESSGTYDAAIFTTNLSNGDYRQAYGDMGSELHVGGIDSDSTSDSSNQMSLWVR